MLDTLLGCEINVLCSKSEDERMALTETGPTSICNWMWKSSSAPKGRCVQRHPEFTTSCEHRVGTALVRVAQKILQNSTIQY